MEMTKEAQLDVWLPRVHHHQAIDSHKKPNNMRPTMENQVSPLIVILATSHDQTQ